MQTRYDKYFPMEVYKAREGEPLYFHQGLRKLKKKVDRLSCKKGALARKKYKAVQKVYKKKYKLARESFFNKALDETVKKDQKRWHSEMKKLMQNGKIRDNGCLPVAPELRNMSDTQKADKIASEMHVHTAAYTPLNKQRVHSRFSDDSLPLLTENDVAEALRKIKIPKGLHADDPPRRLLLEYPSIFAAPLVHIFNNCLQSGVWPSQWKKEVTNLITKRTPVRSTDDYRPIAITLIFAKVLESLVRDVLLLDIDGKLPKMQFGGIKGVSTDHYLMRLYDIIALNRDKGFATVLISLDFKKAFNSLRHDSVIEALSIIGVRSPIIRVIAGYLEGRTNVVRWNDSLSSELPSLGGSGQGTLLSVLLFVIKMNQLITNLDTRIETLEGGGGICTVKTRLLAYIDDLIIVHAFKGSDMSDIYGDRVFSDFGFVTNYLKVVEDFSIESGLQLNQAKSFATTFDWSTHRTFFPEDCLQFNCGKIIKVVDSVKLLGVVIDKNLTFESFVKDKRKKGFFSLWNLKRLEASGISLKHLKIAYESYVSSKIDYGLVSAFPMLNQGQIESLECVQRRATRTFLSISKRYGPDVPSYDSRLSDLGMLKLKESLLFISALFATNGW